MKLVIYNLPRKEYIATRIKDDWGVKRLYRDISIKAPHHSPVLILRFLLSISVDVNRPYAKDSIYRLITNKDFVSEQGHKVDAKAKKDLYQFSKEEVLA